MIAEKWGYVLKTAWALDPSISQVPGYHEPPRGIVFAVEGGTRNYSLSRVHWTLVGVAHNLTENASEEREGWMEEFPRAVVYASLVSGHT